MDENLTVLAILFTIAAVVGLGALLFRSESIRTYGLIGTIRRRLSGGRDHSPYDG